jgi:hypothetical protein
VLTDNASSSFAEHGSPAFESFLTILGDKIELNGFTGYSGGLDCSRMYTLWSLIQSVLK